MPPQPEGRALLAPLADVADGLFDASVSTQSGSAKVPAASGEESERLFDYFAFVEQPASGAAVVRDRYPLADHKDYPLPPNLATCCLPLARSGGNGLWPKHGRTDPTPSPSKPVFFGFVLTSASGGYRYAGCLSYCEPVGMGAAPARLAGSPTSSPVPGGSPGGAGTPPQQPPPPLHVPLHGQPQQPQPQRPSSPARIKLVGRALCIVSPWPFFSLFEDVLRSLHRAARKGGGGGGGFGGSGGSGSGGASARAAILPLERAIVNVIAEFPLPPHGALLTGEVCGTPVLFHRSSSAGLPFLQPGCLIGLFRCLSLDSVVTVLSLLAMEQRVALVSDSLPLLTPCCEALLALLHPFQWRHVYAPVLPLDLADYLEAPVPFFVGLHASAMIGGAAAATAAKGEVFVVYLDDDRIVGPEVAALPGGRFVALRDASGSGAGGGIPRFPQELLDTLRVSVAVAVRRLRHDASAGDPSGFRSGGGGGGIGGSGHGSSARKWPLKRDSSYRESFQVDSSSLGWFVSPKGRAVCAADSSLVTVTVPLTEKRLFKEHRPSRGSGKPCTFEDVAVSVAQQSWCDEVRAAFLEVWCSLFASYRSYLGSSLPPPPPPPVLRTPPPQSTPAASAFSDGLSALSASSHLRGVSDTVIVLSGLPAAGAYPFFEVAKFLEAAPASWRFFLEPLLHTRSFHTFIEAACDAAAVESDLCNVAAVAGEAVAPVAGIGGSSGSGGSGGAKGALVPVAPEVEFFDTCIATRNFEALKRAIVAKRSSIVGVIAAPLPSADGLPVQRAPPRQQQFPRLQPSLMYTPRVRSEWPFKPPPGANNVPSPAKAAAMGPSRKALNVLRASTALRAGGRSRGANAAGRNAPTQLHRDAAPSHLGTSAGSGGGGGGVLKSSSVRLSRPRKLPGLQRVGGNRPLEVEQDLAITLAKPAVAVMFPDPADVASAPPALALVGSSGSTCSMSLSSGGSRNLPAPRLSSCGDRARASSFSRLRVSGAMSQQAQQQHKAEEKQWQRTNSTSSLVRTAEVSAVSLSSNNSNSSSSGRLRRSFSFRRSFAGCPAPAAGAAAAAAGQAKQGLDAAAAAADDSSWVVKKRAAPRAKGCAQM